MQILCPQDIISPKEQTKNTSKTIAQSSSQISQKEMEKRSFGGEELETLELGFKL